MIWVESQEQFLKIRNGVGRSTYPADPTLRPLAKPFLFLREHAPGGLHPCERAPGFVVSGLSSQKRAVVGIRAVFRN